MGERERQMTLLDVNNEMLSADKLNKKFEGEEKSPEEVINELQDPRLNPTYTFNFTYIDERGREWKGEFTNKVLNVLEVSRVASLRASMLGNSPLDAIDLPTYRHTERLAHLTVSLIGRPSWAKADKLEKLYDPNLIAQLYEEAASHEAIFHGRESDPKTSISTAANPAGETEGMVQREKSASRQAS
jgi:hypothetical protein